MPEGARVLLFTGDGKGKTTAALGLAVRAAGHGMRVCFIQFVKDRAVSTGESDFIGQCSSIDLIRSGLGRIPPEEDPDFATHVAAAEEGLKRAREAILSGTYGMVVLDEACIAIERGALSASQVCFLVDMADKDGIIVITGRNAPPELIAVSDTVTEMCSVKHAFCSGRPAQAGVEC